MHHHRAKGAQQVKQVSFLKPLTSERLWLLQAWLHAHLTQCHLSFWVPLTDEHVATPSASACTSNMHIEQDAPRIVSATSPSHRHSPASVWLLQAHPLAQWTASPPPLHSRTCARTAGAPPPLHMRAQLHHKSRIASARMSGWMDEWMEAP
eukprot:1159036-Pelagomonas_calceolata.AAC.3